MTVAEDAQNIAQKIQQWADKNIDLMTIDQHTEISRLTPSVTSPRRLQDLRFFLRREFPDVADSTHQDAWYYRDLKIHLQTYR